MNKLLVVVFAASLAVLSGGQPSLAVPLPPQASPEAALRTHGPDGIELDRRGRPTAAAPYAVDDPAAWDKAEYDAQALTNDAQPDRTDLPTLHAIYIHPSDKPSRFSQYAAMFQADARQASALLNTLYGRGIRFDERSSTTHGTLLDITVFRSKYNSRQLAGSRQFSLVAGELSAAGFNLPNKKYFGWLDAGSKYCGQGHLSQDTRREVVNQNNEGKSLGLVYRPYASDAATGGFCRGRTLRHELGHNLGAVQSVAPNAFDGAHCDDSGEDTMCYTSATSVDTGGPDFDYGNDDYWDPIANPAVPSTEKLPWWAVNLSRFVCPTAGCGAASTPEY